MKITVTPLQSISFEYDLDKLARCEPNYLYQEKSYNYLGALKEDGVILFETTYYLILTDTLRDEQILHSIETFKCRLTKDGADKGSDIEHLHGVLETIFEKVWLKVVASVPTLHQDDLIRPYVDIEFSEKLVLVLDENGFYL